MNNSLNLLQNLLERDFALVMPQVPILKKEANLVCSDNRLLTVIEVRSGISEIPESIGACSHFSQSVHKTYIALPKQQIQSVTNEKKILKEMGIGLISFSKNSYDIVLESKKTNPDRQVLEPILHRMHLMKKVKKTADAYKALSHPTRLHIYLTVYSNGAAKLKDLVEYSGGCYPLLMKHIKILEESNLIESEKSTKETTLKLKSYPVNIGEIANTYTMDR